MYIATILTLLLGLAAASPLVAERRDAPSKVKVLGISLLGTGCPPGSADVQVDATGTLFEASFSAYEVQTGPGTMAADWRKNCKLTLNMEFDEGFQFSILETDMQGFSEIPSGVKGTCLNVFSFTGGSGTATFKQNLGPSDGDFDLKSDPALASWSPCGGSTAILNMNTQCSIAPTHLPALIAVDSVSGKLTVKFAISWKKCHK